MLQRFTVPFVATALLFTVADARAQEIVRDATPGAAQNQPIPSRTDDAGSPEFIIPAELGQLGAGGRNLFHSFREFNLRAGEIATFSGPDSVRNIITRVTGGSPSSIDGTLHSSIEGSNLYFLNPAGLIFGPNASLDLPGSFFASTATQLRLEDGSIFDTRSGGEVPLLSVASPERFGFLNLSAPLTIDDSELRIASGTLGFSGSEVLVTSTPYVVGQALVVGEFGDEGSLEITASNALRFDGGTAGADRVSLRARSITLNASNLSGEELEIAAPDVHVLSTYLESFNTVIAGERVLIGSDTKITRDPYRFSYRPQKPSMLVINGSEEVIIRGGTIDFSTSQEGDFSGDVRISTSRLLLEEASSINLTTLLPFLKEFNNNPFDGNNPAAGGSVKITADQVILRTGGRIDNGSANFAAGGAIEIVANEFVDIGDSESGLFTLATLDGRAGAISIRAPRVTIRNGAKVSTETGRDLYFGDLRLPTYGGSAVDYEEQGFGQGDGGPISITADVIEVDEGAVVSSSTTGVGSGGTIKFKAADSIVISNGSAVTARSTGIGKPGDVELDAGGEIRLADSFIATSGASGSGGEVRLKAKAITAKNGDVLTDVGSGDGGDIDIEAEAFLLLEGSQLVARAGNGKGGRISIRTPAFLRAPGTIIDASAGVGISGVVDIPQAVDLGASLASLSSTYVDASSLLVERCHLRDRERAGSFTVGGHEGMPETPQRKPSARYSPVGKQLDAAESGDFDSFMREAPLAQADSAPVSRLLRSAEVLEAVGALAQARDLLAEALERAGRVEQGRILALRARLWARSGAYGNAERDSRAAERSADELGDAGLRASVLLDRANAAVERGEHPRASLLYARALASAEQAGDVEAIARIGAASAADMELLDAAHRQLGALAPRHDRLFSMLHVGLALAALPEPAAQLRAAEVFAQVAEDAQDLGDRSAQSYAWGYLAELYAREGREADSTELARRALVAAASANRHEAVYRWATALGNALRLTGDYETAARTYDIGLKAVENLHGEAVLSSRAHAKLVAAFPSRPLSMSLVDVLLAQASKSSDPATRGRLLSAARERLETSSRREIRDYFQDECIALEQVKRDEALDDFIAIYPVLLDDRAEVIVSDGREFSQIRVAASASEVREKIQSLRALLEDRSTHEYREPAARLYELLIRPLESVLSRNGSERTLVVVPSGAFASIPFAALYDGRQQKFLIEQRPVAISPGLSLIESRALQAGPHAALYAALTQPVGDFPALSAAGSEVARVQQLLGGKILLDAEFVGTALNRELSTIPYEIMHIASHGEFGVDPDSAFLLTYDGRIGMSEVADLISRTRFRDRPLELLTLSACQTAAGDERAALGLAGVAVRAGARSTLASLWFVNDLATARLMESFYAELVQGNASRARSLQLAQRALLRDATYRHPAYWAPFVLVGSWR